MKEKLFNAIRKTEINIAKPKMYLLAFEVTVKESTSIEKIITNPAKMLKELKVPTKLSVFCNKVPKDNILGRKTCAIWKTTDAKKEIIKPLEIKSIAFLSLKINEEKNISKKAANIKKKEPVSSSVPNKEKPIAFEKILDKNVTKSTISADQKIHDLWIIIFLSKNLAIAQKIIETESPETKINPFEISTGIFVKGKKKNGREIIVIKSDQKDILSKIFDILFCKN